MLKNQPGSDANPVVLPHPILLDVARAKQLRETTSSWGLRKAIRAEQDSLQGLGEANNMILIDGDTVPWIG